nr:ABC transporter permease [uncultured Selenomonas sp.]
MARILLRRLLMMLVILFLLSVITFLLMHTSDSDPVKLYMIRSGIIPTPELIAEVRARYGLDEPIWVQYFVWLRDLFSGDLGYSLLFSMPVATLLKDAIPNTILLAVSAMGLSILISVPLAVLAFRFYARPLDLIIRFGSFFGITIPTIWLSLIFIYIFSVKLSLIPIHTTGLTGLILPSLVLSFYYMGLYVRRLRGALLEEHKKDYVTGARALGLSDSRILWRYIMPNALPNIITMFGLSFGSLLGGTVVIEAIFGWRGMGFLMVEAIKNNDFTLMQAYVLWGAGIFILVNLAADILCLWLNPKVREQEVG